MSSRKRNREYQNKLVKVKRLYLEDESKRKSSQDHADRYLQDEEVFQEFCCDVTKLPLDYYYKCLKLCFQKEERSVETIIETIVEFFDKQNEQDKSARKNIESAMDKYINMYFPEGCTGYNEDLDRLIEKAEQIKEGMHFNILKKILEKTSKDDDDGDDNDDSWELVAKHLNPEIQDAKIKERKTSLDKKCYAFINLVPKRIYMKDLCPELLFAFSEYCECEVKSDEVEKILDDAIADKNAEYY